MRVDDAAVAFSVNRYASIRELVYIDTLGALIFALFFWTQARPTAQVVTRLDS